MVAAAQAMFAPGAVTTLSANNEAVFGLETKVSCVGALVAAHMAVPWLVKHLQLPWGLHQQNGAVVQ